MPINKTSLALVLVFAAQIPEICSASSVSYACQTPASKALPFCDSRLSFEDRVKDLTGRLTPGEKVSLMGAHGNDICAFEDGGVPRLDIPSYTWCTETNTGVSTQCLQPGKCATTFPSPAALAAPAMPEHPTPASLAA